METKPMTLIEFHTAISELVADGAYFTVEIKVIGFKGREPSLEYYAWDGGQVRAFTGPTPQGVIAALKESKATTTLEDAGSMELPVDIAG